MDSASEVQPLKVEVDRMVKGRSQNTKRVSKNPYLMHANKK